jgi:hypothetical protein
MDRAIQRGMHRTMQRRMQRAVQRGVQRRERGAHNDDGQSQRGDGGGVEDGDVTCVRRRLLASSLSEHCFSFCSTRGLNGDPDAASARLPLAGAGAGGGGGGELKSADRPTTVDGSAAPEPEPTPAPEPRAGGPAARQIEQSDEERLVARR